MRPWFSWRLMILLIVVWSIIFYIYWLAFPQINSKIGYSPVELLWWTSVPGYYKTLRKCGKTQCLVSNKRQRLPEAQGVLFYAPDIIAWDMPLPRMTNKYWALLHDESPRNVPFAPQEFFLQHFNYTSTFSRYSDLPLTTQYLPHITDISSMDYVNYHSVKETLEHGYSLATIVFLQSDCDTMSGREDYVRQLMKYIRIDSYGTCLHNRDLPAELQKDYLNNMYSPDILAFLSRYKFMLAIENAVCEDYITEKFWRPIILGVIPLYFGAPNIRDWAPNEQSAIYLDDYKNPSQLAEYLYKVDEDPNLYNKYLRHKLNTDEPLQNKFLLRTLFNRKYSVADGKLFEAFECMACTRITYHGSKTSIKMANKSHYGCSEEPKYVPLAVPPQNHAQWSSIMAVGRCQAQLLNKLWLKNQPYKKKQYNKALEHMVSTGLCN